jgi:hypothetical protein
MIVEGSHTLVDPSITASAVKCGVSIGATTFANANASAKYKYKSKSKSKSKTSVPTSSFTSLPVTSSVLTSPFISSYRLNRSYDFVGVFDARAEENVPVNERIRPHTSEIFVACRHLGDIVRSFKVFKKAELGILCDFYGIQSKRTIKQMILSILLAHPTEEKLPVLIFKERLRPRPLSGVDMRLITIDVLQGQLEDTQRRANNVRRQRQHVNPVHTPGFTVPHSSQSSLLSGSQSLFPYHLAEDHKHNIIRRWQETGPDHFREKACAVCGMGVQESDIHIIHADNIDLTLLRNLRLTCNEILIPKSYNYEAYDQAILYHAGLITPQMRGYMQICGSCTTSLVNKHKQPIDSWANGQYYALDCLPDNVTSCLKTLSDFDKMMICRARASKITHIYNEKPGVFEEDGTSRGYNAGNVAILPQDTATLRDTLPPNHDEIQESICAVFINHTAQVTRQNIMHHRPVLVSKNNVKTMLEFLMTYNTVYASPNGPSFSAENLKKLYEDDNPAAGIPISVEVRSLNNQIIEPNSFKSQAPLSEVIVNENSSTNDLSSPHELLMEAVGYTSGDFSHNSYKYMKAVALEACIKGQKFVQVRSGSSFADDENFYFLTNAFPHLDPWGIGGFNSPYRTPEQKISFERQLKNMLRQHNRHFIEDPNFAYVCWNILQKQETRKCIAFKTSERRRQRVTDQLPLIYPGLKSMIQKWKTRPYAVPQTEIEKKALKLLSMVRMIPKSLHGSAAYKQCRRNEIRSLLKRFGTPALFVTLTPDDKTNELIGALGNIPEDEWYSMTELDRKIFVAKHPDLAARAFDLTMQKFLDIVLKPSDGSLGAFGECEAYYGMVEAQGRGMLHCHFLIWLRGNPNPQKLRDMMRNAGFQNSMFSWLEGIIKCELPDDTEVVSEPNGPLLQPRREYRGTDVRFEKPIQLKDLPKKDFDIAYKDQIKQIVMEYNWHEHRETCWKHLHPGEPRDDTTCRMRMNGSTNPTTYVDEQTGSIVLRRLHPRISNYNELITFLLRSNNDIKYIGSGEAAKALVYYVTDYVTKSELPLHAGLAAIQAAMEKTEAQYTGLNVSSESHSRSLLIKSLNAIMARTELSHQQVMSYLVGGGDVYRSHNFNTMIWSNVEQYLGIGHSDEPSGYQEMVHIDVETNNKVTVSNEVRDYAFRDMKYQFDNLCLYDYIAQAYKIRDLGAATASESITNTDNIGRFTEGHTQRLTHIVRLRQSEFIPVILGRRFPRPDAGEKDKEEWCKAMLCLFKPWRSIDDLKNSEEAWSTAFDQTVFQSHHLAIMLNIHVENECKDARDSHSAEYHRQRRIRRQDNSGIETRFLSDIMNENDDENEENDDNNIFDLFGNDCQNAEEEAFDSELCQILSSSGLLEEQENVEVESYGTESQMTENDIGAICAQQIMMEKYRREKRPSIAETSPNKRRRLNNSTGLAVTTIQQLSTDNPIVYHQIHPRKLHKKSEMKEIVNSIIQEFTMEDNEEQQCALRIIADHFISGTDDQLLMYIGGMGGTGKSHVIEAIIEFFQQCGYSEKLLVSAPTGCAAVLISGYTIHALTFLPSSKVRANQEELEKIWKDVKYLIIDEVSMISAYLLGQISERISKARAAYGGADRICGNVNVIFLGDPGQLPPVGALPLFSRELSNTELAPKIKETYAGQIALRGAFIWHHISKVVLLKKNQRADKDPKFANLLNRIRLGVAWDGRNDMTDLQLGTGINYNEPDELTLQKRDLHIVLRSSSDAKRKFKDAPIIVAKRRERDRINAVKVKQYADSIGEEVNEYHSRDSCMRELLEGDVQQRVWNVPSSQTSDALGKLPMVPGMRVMVTENVAMMARVVNGSEGRLTKILWESDELGRRYAKCAYVSIEESNVKIPGLDPHIVPIFPVKTYFKFQGHRGQYSIVREQLPLVPAYSFTDYKCQGRTLDTAIVDLTDARSLQNVYVMLSRCRTLKNLAILRPFPSKKIYNRLSEEFRREFYRLEAMDRATQRWYNGGELYDKDTNDIFTGV